MRLLCSLAILICLPAADLFAADRPVDFTTDIRPILSNKCFACHGPDEAVLEAGLRLDRQESALGKLESGNHAIVPGKPEASEVLARLKSTDDEVRMPPKKFGKPLEPHEIELIERWIVQGAPYAAHWSYVKPVRPPLPMLANAGWCRNDIDYFILSRLISEGLSPATEADRHTLIRRVALDLTGLPPTPEEVEQFVNDADPQAYEHLVDHMLAKPAYGEHWARKWLDLARYADSAGYADDPPRTIWAYRDWVIRSLNSNMPFDQFTVEQIAGDLLPNPTDDQLTATAFHRNTLTNNEGGTNDEEFRNVAIVDRVNTTMATWMGTTMACAQCHNHKYDPISQKDFFRFFAILNNTQDADRRDESPLLEIYSDEQRQQKSDWQTELASLQQTLSTLTPELAAELQAWEVRLQAQLDWRSAVINTQGVASQAKAEVIDSVVTVTEPQPKNLLTINIPVSADSVQPIQAIRLNTFPDAKLPGGGSGYGGGNFVITRVLGNVQPQGSSRAQGRYVRVEMPGQKQFLSLAEVQVFSGSENVAIKGKASQISTDFGGPAELAIDGNTSGVFTDKSTTHTGNDDSPWWEVDLQSVQSVDHITLWNRADNVGSRLKDFKVSLLDENRGVVWEQTTAESPNPNIDLTLSGVRGIPFIAAFADYEQNGFSASGVLDSKDPDKTGWAVGGSLSEPHQLTLIPSSPVQVAAGDVIALTIEQNSQFENHIVGRLGVQFSHDARAVEMAAVPANILDIARMPVDQRTAAQSKQLSDHFLSNVSQLLEPSRKRLVDVQKSLAEQKPMTTVPIYREQSADQLRKTFIQLRGNFMVLGDEVSPGLPDAFPPLPEGTEPNRLGLARWLVDESNPLTPRVIANRYWEAIFGRGLVLTSEEFGSQGELPSHPELLDWLASELRDSTWNTKAFLKLLVTSAAYRQSSAVTPDLYERDPDNMLLARGPRVRLTAEMIRDQTLAVAGLLSSKMYGPPVKPMQPNMGLSAAFGGGIDWQTSDGEDRYRRGLYTNWRRSNPYPSMATFDAPNREVCTVRRTRTNTPLQALVTLNDPVYVEAAQSLARLIAKEGTSPEEKAASMVTLCLSRPAHDEEVQQLAGLHRRALGHFEANADAAMQLATNPIGPVPEGMTAPDLAAWTAVANVVLNLDEMFMKR